jgi:hypothetical protein
MKRISTLASKTTESSTGNPLFAYIKEEDINKRMFVRELTEGSWQTLVADRR